MHTNIYKAYQCLKPTSISNSTLLCSQNHRGKKNKILLPKLKVSFSGSSAPWEFCVSYVLQYTCPHSIPSRYLVSEFWMHLTRDKWGKISESTTGRTVQGIRSFLKWNWDSFCGQQNLYCLMWLFWINHSPAKQAIKQTEKQLINIRQV